MEITIWSLRRRARRVFAEEYVVVLSGITAFLHGTILPAGEGYRTDRRDARVVQLFLAAGADGWLTIQHGKPTGLIILGSVRAEYP